jgi:hypothetical protein
MHTRNIVTKVSLVIALIALASTVTIWEVRRVRATHHPIPNARLAWSALRRDRRCG